MHFHYKVPDKNELEVFEMNDDFLISFNDFANDIRKRPYLGKSVGLVPCQHPALSRDELELKIKAMKKSSSFFTKKNSALKNLLNHVLKIQK